MVLLSSSITSYVGLNGIYDEIAIRDLIELVLRRENYVVQTAENGKIALQLLDTFGPDLVVLDLMLP
ncbi:response regulator [Paenibacillus amylolyticus]|uniref:response regulator n=1 Tax=Paenibacillus amylolyticus TaxID=1451 RepID=UPI003D26AE28